MARCAPAGTRPWRDDIDGGELASIINEVEAFVYGQGSIYYSYMNGIKTFRLEFWRMDLNLLQIDIDTMRATCMGIRQKYGHRAQALDLYIAILGVSIQFLVRNHTYMAKLHTLYTLYQSCSRATPGEKADYLDPLADVLADMKELTENDANFFKDMHTVATIKKMRLLRVVVMHDHILQQLGLPIIDQEEGIM